VLLQVSLAHYNLNKKSNHHVHAQKKGNVCLGILNGTAIGIVDTNVFGGNETPYCFSPLITRCRSPSAMVADVSRVVRNGCSPSAEW
jgi:hypothetical protein